MSVLLGILFFFSWVHLVADEAEFNMVREFGLLQFSKGALDRFVFCVGRRHHSDQVIAIEFQCARLYAAGSHHNRRRPRGDRRRGAERRDQRPALWRNRDADGAAVRLRAVATEPSRRGFLNPFASSEVEMPIGLGVASMRVSTSLDTNEKRGRSAHQPKADKPRRRHNSRLASPRAPNTSTFSTSVSILCCSRMISSSARRLIS